jgi:methylated-DNA-[protein]-cysteine S-methyltransferase
MSTLYVSSFKTRLGIIYTAATDRGLALVSLPGESRRSFDKLVASNFKGFDIKPGGALNKKAETQVRKYLDGKLKRFDLKLDIQGTSFEKRALARVAKISYGKTATYGQVARAIGHPLAARAVGAANARNRLPLVIPCHRVVAANGLGGYGGGLPMKRKLLEMEGAL